MKQRVKIIFLVLAFFGGRFAAVFFYRFRHPLYTGKTGSEAAHYSYFSQKDFYEQAYAAANKIRQTANRTLRRYG